MNIVMDMNRDKAMLNLARHLKKNGILTNGLFVFNDHNQHTNEFFHISQKDLQSKVNEGLVFDVDIFEQNSQAATLWRWVAAERRIVYVAEKGHFAEKRCVYSHREVIQIVKHVSANVEDEVFKKFKPDLIIMTDVVRLYKFCMVEIAHRRGIPVMYLLPTRLGKRNAFSNTPYENFRFCKMRFYNSNFDPAVKPIVLEYFESVLSGKRQYHDAAQMSGLGPTEKKHSLSQLFQEALSYQTIKMKQKVKMLFTQNFLIKRGKKKSYLFKPVSPVLRFKEIFKVWFRRKLSKLLYSFDKIDMNDNYIFFPMHSEPETALSLNAPHIASQQDLILSIAASLPIQMKLYVKDHPRMHGLRSTAYYSELKKRAPNIKVLDPTLDALSIIPKSKLVIIISGTAGMEALIHGIPVIALGACHFQHLPGVKRLDNLAKLPAVIRSELNSCLDANRIKENVLNYLTATVSESFPIGWYSDLTNGSDYDYNSEEFTAFKKFVSVQIKKVVQDEGWIQPLNTGVEVDS